LEERLRREEEKTNQELEEFAEEIPHDDSHNNEQQYQRLGNTEENIHDHPWFAGINWTKLEKKKVSPPFRPPVRGVKDISQIDPVFTQEQPVDSYVETHLSESMLAFDNFTMVGQSALSEAINNDES
jgi:hypothetical protein